MRKWIDKLGDSRLANAIVAHEVLQPGTSLTRPMDLGSSNLGPTLLTDMNGLHIDRKGHDNTRRHWGGF